MKGISKLLNEWNNGISVIWKTRNSSCHAYQNHIKLNLRQYVSEASIEVGLNQLKLIMINE